MGFADTDFVILQVARLDYLKDHATAIRALAQLFPQRADVRLGLVGEGPELEAIKELVRQHQLEAHVRFLGLRKDVARLLTGADLFLLTSISEGIPLTVIEAMAAGLPVVSTRVGGLPEVVEEGRTGLMEASGDYAGLARAVCELAAEPEMRREMGRLGRQRAIALFSEQHMHAQYGRLYREMLGG
jgi:glycosyltransferase involved in cell wall biosynthesis